MPDKKWTPADLPPGAVREWLGIPEDEIERVAREMCVADGKNPDQITGMSFMPPHPMRWEEYRSAARAKLAAS